MYITHLTERHLPNCEDYYIEHDNLFHLKTELDGFVLSLEIIP